MIFNRSITEIKYIDLIGINTMQETYGVYAIDKTQVYHPYPGNFSSKSSILKYSLKAKIFLKLVNFFVQ